MCLVNKKFMPNLLLERVVIIKDRIGKSFFYNFIFYIMYIL